MCVRDFFKRRFGYESELYPKFSDIERVDNLDADIACSGFTKDMAKDIDMELGIISEDDSISDKNSDTEDAELDTASCLAEDELIKSDTKNQSEMQIPENLKSDALQETSDNEKFSDCSSESNYSNDIFESRSVRSTATTIHPDEIKRRVRKQMVHKNKKESRKKCVAKGEASAVTRNRRENTNTIKQSNGIWE